MTQIGGFIEATRRPGVLGVHSLDHFSMTVPDLEKAKIFYESFGNHRWSHVTLAAYGLGPRPQVFFAQVCIGISGKQQRLLEDEARRPDGRAATEPWQDELADDRLHFEQQQRAEKRGQGVSADHQPRGERSVHGGRRVCC